VAEDRELARDIVQFTQAGSGLHLRKYQVEVARAVIHSAMDHLGLSIVVMFPRQSGKNELQAQIEAYLLGAFNDRDCEIVKVSPTWKPQSLNAMRRLERALRRNIYTREDWVKEQGYIYRLGQARIYFFSGAPVSNIVGATASLLLECDEAQDVGIEKWDREISPMAAAYNATRVFWGTAWTADTLLGRELRLARQAEQEDGLRRAFVLTADQVALEVPDYGKFVAEQVRRLGRSHPMVRTQFYSEELDSESGMFTPQRLALMQGEHTAQQQPEDSKIYALLVDVGGEQALKSADLTGSGQTSFTNLLAVQNNPSHHDSTAATIVEVDLSSLSDDGLQAPTYRVVHRRLWTGVRHSLLYGQIKALAEHWHVQRLLIDATGVGAGLASFLGRSLGEGRVIPFTFTARSKSDLGWGFLAVIETGRYKEYLPGSFNPEEQNQLQEVFWQQARLCRSQVLPGPGQLLRWGTPDGSPVHDDLLISAGLCAALDGLAWSQGISVVLPPRDPLAGLPPVY